jgi:hypothetical protein
MSADDIEAAAPAGGDITEDRMMIISLAELR